MLMAKAMELTLARVQAAAVVVVVVVVVVGEVAMEGSVGVGIMPGGLPEVLLTDR
jgi:hypothetical protein